MAKKFWQTPEFKRQQKHWYQVLADEGFEDIESLEFPESRFIRKHYIQMTSVYERGKRTHGEFYYSMAGGWYWSGTFDDDWDRFVWLKHAEGLTEDQIVAELKSSMEHLSTSRYPVNCAIKRVKEQMLNSAWYHNYEYDGYLSPYDTSTQIYGEIFDD